MTAASLSPTTVPAGQPGGTPVILTAHVNAPIAPVNGYELFMFDAAGEAVLEQFGGIGTHNGVMEVDFRIKRSMPPGEYTVGFSVFDASGLFSSYGIPGSPPVPGGPLTITVEQ